MKHARTLALMLGVAGVAVVAMSSNPTYSQGNDPNAYPNPYKLDDTWFKQQESERVTSIQRQRLDSFLVDNISDRCIGSLQLFGSTLDSNRFSYLTDLHCHVDREWCANFQRIARLLKLFEALLLNCDCVGPGG